MNYRGNKSLAWVGPGRALSCPLVSTGQQALCGTEEGTPGAPGAAGGRGGEGCGDDGTAVSLQGWQVGVGPLWPVCQGLAPSSRDSVMKRAKERPGTGRGAGKQSGRLSKQFPGLAQSSASLLPRRQAPGFPGSGMK